MKNNHSYYFDKLLTKCIYVTPDKCPALRISDTIRLLQEYANDVHDEKCAFCTGKHSLESALYTKDGIAKVE